MLGGGHTGSRDTANDESLSLTNKLGKDLKDSCNSLSSKMTDLVLVCYKSGMSVSLD